MERHTSSALTASFSRTAPIVATSGYDKTAILWDITIPSAPHRLAVLTGHGRQVRPAEFHPRGDVLLIRDSSGQTVLWDIAERVEVFRDPLGRACAISGGPTPEDGPGWGRDQDRPVRVILVHGWKS